MPPAGTSGSRMDGGTSGKLLVWLRRVPVHPSPSAQAKPSRPSRPTGQGRSSSRALHFHPWGLVRSPGGWADGDGMNRQAGACAIHARWKSRNRRSGTGSCARICARDAAGRTEIGETWKVGGDVTPQVRRGQRGEQKPCKDSLGKNLPIVPECSYQERGREWPGPSSGPRWRYGMAGSRPVPTASHCGFGKRSSRRSRLHPTRRNQPCGSTGRVRSTSLC